MDVIVTALGATFIVLCSMLALASVILLGTVASVVYKELRWGHDQSRRD